MRIYIVEDDYLQSGWIFENVQQAFPRAEVIKINTEHEFVTRLDEIAKHPSETLIIMDAMLRWTDPAPVIPPAPENVRQEGFYRSGLRCIALLNRREETKDIPVILYTVLEHEDLKDELRDLPPNVSHLVKESDSQPIIDEIRRILWPKRD